jgi:hypothetical protein
MISTITALKTKLYVAKLDDDRLADCSHALMRQLFFPKHGSHNRFFSFTRSSQETSLILEEGALADFPPFSLTIVKTQWRALSVSLGSVGYTGTGIVSSLSGLLAKAGIALFYLSTSSTDFILVPAQKIDQAIAALKSSFTIYSEGDLELDEEEDQSRRLNASSGELPGASSSASEIDSSRASTASIGTSGDIFESLQQHTLEMQGSSEIFKLSAETPPCTLLHDELRLCHIEMEHREICAFAILKLMFFTADRTPFWSISETEDEMSLLIPDKFLDFFPPDALNASEIWRPIQRFKKTSYTEVGVVAALSAPLARGRIPLLYMSTYLSAFILVQKKNVNAATICLQSGKFQVVDQHATSLP